MVGIESDQLVFDYLSRVGDLAHSTRMSAAERARLVGGLRGEIDKARAAEGGAVTKAAVRKILDRIGRPEDVVAAAAGGESPRPPTPSPSPSAPSGATGADTPPSRPAFPFRRRDDKGDGDGKGGKDGKGATVGSGGGGPEVPLPHRPSVPAQRTGTPTAAFGASSPHLASLDELGPEDTDPDWWRVDTGPFGSGPGPGTMTAEGPVPGFTGGIELPEILKPPPGDGDKPAAPSAPAAPGAEGGAQPVEQVVPPPAKATGLGALLRWRRGLRGNKGERVGRRGGFVELAAAALLVAGAVIGSLVPLAAGWLAAWWSPRLSRTEAKWATLGMPGIVAAAGGVWLWGRMEGRWGERIAQGGDALGTALGDTFPVLLRAAAVASAVYLIWRSRRPTEA
ncbi:hypothetical protein SUDANB19_03061 [Streptomyces sp. enrichment culture]